MRTRLFEWATEQKLSMGELATMTGYSRRQLERARRRGAVPQEFQARVVLKLGDWARSLFFPEVSHDNHTVSVGCASAPALPPSPAPAKRTAPAKPNHTSGRAGTRTARPSGPSDEAA